MLVMAPYGSFPLLFALIASSSVTMPSMLHWITTWASWSASVSVLMLEARLFLDFGMVVLVCVIAVYCFSYFVDWQIHISKSSIRYRRAHIICHLCTIQYQNKIFIAINLVNVRTLIKSMSKYLYLSLYIIWWWELQTYPNPCSLCFLVDSLFPAIYWDEQLTPNLKENT